MKRLALLGAAVFSALVACGDDDFEGAQNPDDSDASAPSSSSGSNGGGSTSSGALPDAGNPDADGGPVTGCFPAANAVQSWDDRFTLAGLTGLDGVTPKVYDFAVEPDGGLLVAGYFRWAGALRVPGLARWKDGAWSAGRADFGALPVPEGGFTAMALGPDGQLALAASLGGASGNDEIWLQDASGWRSIGSFARRAHRMKFVGNDLWVAGGVELADDGPKGLAIWNGTSWHGAAGGDPDGYVYDLMIDGDDVLVAGGFEHIGGVASARVARWNGATWTSEYGFLPAESNYVATLARDADGALHAGGLFAFAESGEGESSSFAKWNGTTWEVAGGGVTETNGTGVVNQLLLHTDGSLYASGCFHFAGGFEGDPGAVASNSIAKWDGTAWTALDRGDPFVNSPWFDFGKCGFEGSPEDLWDVQRQRLVSLGDAVIQGGSFGGIDGVPSQSIASYTAPAWSALGMTGQGIHGDVNAFSVDPSTCDVHALVSATHVAGQPLTSRALRWNGDAWEQLGTGLPERVRCTHLLFGGAQPLLHCNVIAEFGQETPTFFTLENGAWQSHALGLGTLFDVKQAPDGTIWVAGADADFNAVLGRWNGTALEPLDADFDAPVARLGFVPGAGAAYDLVVGGYFSTIGSVQASRIARFDGTTWFPYGTGLATGVSAIAYDSGKLYVATDDEGSGADVVLGTWDGTAWVEQATPAHQFPATDPDTSTAIRQIVPLGDGRLLLGGSIWAGASGRHAYTFDGTRFAVVGGGVDASDVSAVAVSRDGYWFGGTYVAEAGLDGSEASSALTASVGVAHRRFVAP